MGLLNKGNISKIKDSGKQYLMFRLADMSSVKFPGENLRYRNFLCGFYTQEQIKDMKYDRDDFTFLYFLEMNCSVKEAINILDVECRRFNSSIQLLNAILKNYPKKFKYITFEQTKDLFMK